MDLRRGQREYLNVLYAPQQSLWRLATFDDPDFDPGFATELPVDHRHVFEISVFADNAQTTTRSLVFEPAQDGHDPQLRLL
jgi:hypothetical protein